MLTHAAIAERRLLNQGVTRARHKTPADVVSALGAVQAQEFEPAKWGLGLRMRHGVVNADIQHEFDEGRILRTHVMRPTWHFVTPVDIRWLLELTAPRVHRVMAPYNRQLELDQGTLARGTAILERALSGGRFLTRAELGERLQNENLALTGTRLAHLAMHAELEGVICSGPRRGKQSTYALVAERAPHARLLKRDEALGELSRRYFSSHGPATVRDFMWWSGLTSVDAKRAIEIGKARRHELNGHVYWGLDRPGSRSRLERRVHLLPIYDEYLIAYRDRHAVPHGPSMIGSGPGGWVRFQHALIVDGQVAGTWRLARSLRFTSIQAAFLRTPTASERQALADAVRRYERFQGISVELSIR